MGQMYPNEIKDDQTRAVSNLTRFKVIVDYGWPDLIEVLQSVDYLHNDGAPLFFRHELVLLQVEIQIIALAVLQDGAEPAPKQADVNC